jgi:predicted metal-dependent hydrolase
MSGACRAGQGSFALADGRRIPWRLSVSSRARHTSVRMDSHLRLIVTVPGCRVPDPEKVLETHRPWIERTYSRLSSDIAEKAPWSLDMHPSRVSFPAVGRSWDVVFEPREGGSAACRMHGHELVVSGAVDDADQVACALKRFAVRTAKRELPPLLDRISCEKGLGYASCRVGNARTRWGSCSTDAAIMLSARCLFLPEELVYHVVCHELAHTVHMDHSNRFHTLLAHLDPLARDHAHALRESSVMVPIWMG